MSKQTDEIVLATTRSEADLPLIAIAGDLGISYFQGETDDVLRRFADAAVKFKAKTIVRVCADNPFVDGAEVDRLIRYYHNSECDYACNHRNILSNQYADGFGAEIFDNSLLQRLDNELTSYRHREHVTLGILDNPEKYDVRALRAPTEIAFPNLRFDLDTVDDLRKLKNLVEFGVSISTSAAQVVSITQKNCYRLE